MTTLIAPTRQIVPVGIGQIVTVVADATSTGRCAILSDTNAQVTSYTALAASATQTYGPFPVVKYLHVESLTGAGVAFTVAPADANGIEVIGDFSTIRFISGSGAPSGTTGQNVAGGASMYFDVQNGAIYLNVGSASSPSWKSVSHA